MAKTFSLASDKQFIHTATKDEKTSAGKIVALYVSEYKGDPNGFDITRAGDDGWVGQLARVSNDPDQLRQGLATHEALEMLWAKPFTIAASQNWSWTCGSWTWMWACRGVKRPRSIGSVAGRGGRPRGRESGSWCPGLGSGPRIRSSSRPIRRSRLRRPRIHSRRRPVRRVRLGRSRRDFSVTMERRIRSSVIMRTPAWAAWPVLGSPVFWPNSQGLCLVNVGGATVKKVRVNDYFGWSKYGVKPAAGEWKRVDMANGQETGGGDDGWKWPWPWQ
ncbi:unnamed protein product [Linum tenue]|uniref:Uncharacterized protein n=1 Tax=Linum tenue TaxID=586396 RepID=A0AAV0PMC3_9ROSI|nr:unnamed protein product [Linum tenue]